MAIITICNCNRNGIQLSIDGTKAASWRYLLGVDISGTAPNSTTVKQKFNSSLRTFLQGQPSGSSKDKISLFITGTRITTDFLSEAQRVDIENQFEKHSFQFALKEGAIIVSDTQSIRVLDVQGWDLYRNFAKVFPVFPQSPVQQGDKWERERQFPVQSNYGNAMGHLYQHFTLDSIKLIDTETHHAYISWQFSYKVEPSEKSISSQKLFPFDGNGAGHACLNLKHGVLEFADAYFEASGDPEKEKQVKWREAIHIELVK